MELICPLCGSQLNQEGKTLRCGLGHSFDIARQGYVHLLPVQQKRSLHPGDTREQVLSRREFLEAGYYAPICQALVEAARKYPVQGPILDVGCGEGYYSTRLAKALGLPLTGLDISKEAVRCAAARYKDSQWLCASAARIPAAQGSVGLLTSLFAVTLPEEFSRVVVPGGYFFQVLAAQDHLLGLKGILYDTLNFKEKDTVPEVPGFLLETSIPIRFSLALEGKQIQNLFAMTPHVFRVGEEGARRIRETQVLTDTASCVLNVYRRI